MDIVLVHPEIAPNTGAIIRLAANAGARLHLVEPLGFDLDDRLMSRAGLDYHEIADLSVHTNLTAARTALPNVWWGFSSHAHTSYAHADIGIDDVLVFGAERAGLTTEASTLIGPDNMLCIPMRPGNRSLNLANAASVVVYDVWRRHGFEGAGSAGASTVEAPFSEPFDI